MSKRLMMLENYIHDLAICITDGDTHPDKNIKAYFTFEGDKAIFPRESDEARHRGIGWSEN
jgi:hypothetical protein